MKAGEGRWIIVKKNPSKPHLLLCCIDLLNITDSCHLFRLRVDLRVNGIHFWLEFDQLEPGDMSNNTEFADKVGSCSSSKDHSIVWNYFDKLPLGQDGVKKASCIGCGKVFQANKGKLNMKRHLPECFVIDEPGPPKKRAHLDQVMYREKLAYSIIKHNYPFSYVEHEATRDLLEFLNPDVTPITRNTAEADVLKIYDREKTNLKEKLQKVTSRICLTTDLWSSITTDRYMALTAHYIDDNWVLRKKVLNFKVIRPPYNGKFLAKHMISFLRDWGIEKKVFTITVDDAKYNDVFVKWLNGNLLCDGDFTRVRCCGRVLDLIVQGALKVIEGTIEKVRESVKYVRGSSDRKYKFAECIHQMRSQCGKKVHQDIVTKWNSTYLMLDSALAYRHAYTRLAILNGSEYPAFPSKQEWERVETIIKFLKPFYNITTLFSRNSYPTSNLYFLNVWKIQKCIEDQINNVDKVISEMANKMKKKFDKYWESYSMILSFAVVLDPRYKFKVVEFCFKKLKMTDEVCKTKLDIILKGIHKLYDKKYGILSRINSSTTESSNICVDTLDDLDGFESFTSEFEGEKSQLDMYLEEPELNYKEELDVLQYWKENQGRYPQLSLMARDILSIPIITFASKSSFSFGGRVLSKYRSSLPSSNVEALLCTRDWLFDLEDENENDIEERLAEDIECMFSIPKENKK